MAQHDGRAGVNHAAVPRGEPDVVHIAHPGELPAVKSKLERRDPQRFRDLREPTHYAVVKEVSRAMSDGKSSTAETPAWRQGEQCGRTCATRIPTCTGPDQAARNRACASCFHSPSRAVAWSKSGNPRPKPR